MILTFIGNIQTIDLKILKEIVADFSLELNIISKAEIRNEIKQRELKQQKSDEPKE